MKKGKYILTLLAAAILSACTDYDVDHLFTVGEADNAITLHAGVAEGGSGVMTRGVDGNHAAGANGGGHKAFSTTNPTQLRLRVDGTWRKPSSATENIYYATTATTGEVTGADNKHNKLTFSPTLYWDDYGTADPENMSLKDASNNELHTGNGRDKGLTIYGVAVNEKNLPTTATDGRAALSTLTSSTFKNIAWNVGTASSNVVDQTSGWDNYDIITSNNIKDGNDGTLKFDDLYPTKKLTASDLLEFTHAMSKITVELTAGEGFTIPNGGSAPTFKNNVSVTLLDFYYMGKVDVEGKTSKATKTDGSEPTVSEKAAAANIKMHLDNGGVNNNKATFDAIVFPGNKFTATIGTAPDYKPTSTDQLLELNADGNIYKVTAGELVKAIKGTGTTSTPVDATIEQGWNYLIKITVNKTKIEKIEATIVDWKTYETEGQIIPKINVTASYGQTMSSTNMFAHNFEFFRSLSKDQEYSKDATVTHTESSGVHSYTLSTPLYWPDHATHYFFRGVYPLIGSTTGQIPEAKVTASDTEKQKEYIAVENVRYAADTYPSDLAIGYPRTTSESCSAHSKDVDTYGICATEGTITMNFEYAMSQVEVKLSTTEDTDDSHVIIDENTVIKIVGGYSAANILLKDGNASYTGISKADWTMPLVESDYANRHDAIVPQTLGDMKFSVTVKNSNDTYDTYECKIADIQVKEKLSDGTYGALTSITAWESGKKYVYELKLKKTAITAVATITPWTEVKAEENIWF